MELRSPKNIVLQDTCPHCRKRVWYKGENREKKRVYFAPKWFRDFFKSTVGAYSLGTYYITRCEVCGKMVAVFNNNIGRFYDDVFVFYSCTLLAKPLPEADGIRCEDQTCYGCPLKKGALYVKRK
jgi:hypothetical protein